MRQAKRCRGILGENAVSLPTARPQTATQRKRPVPVELDFCSAEARLRANTAQRRLIIRWGKEVTYLRNGKKETPRTSISRARARHLVTNLVRAALRYSSSRFTSISISSDCCGRVF